MLRPVRTVRALAAVVLAGATVSLAACGGGDVLTRDDRFPTSEALGELLAAPVDPSSFRAGVVVDSWTFAGLRDRYGFEVVRPDASIEDAAAIAPADLPHTAGLACTATEIARFYTANEAFPRGEVLDVMGSRCGTTMRVAGQYGYHWEGNVTAERRADYIAEARELLADVDGWGIGEVVDGDRHMVVVIGGEMMVQVDPAPMRVGADTVEVSGMALGDVEQVAAMITQGATGADECERDLSVAWPTWRFTCSALPGDDMAEIEVIARERDRLLFSGGARFSVSPSGNLASTWELRSIEVSGDASFDEAMVDNINRWREAVGLGPLRYEPAQSAVLSQAVPRLFSPDTRERDRDQISMGLMAGWQVSRPRSSASLHTGSVNADSPERAGAELIASPWSRYALLDADADAIAIGVQTFGEVVGACVTTYDDFVGGDADAIADALMVRLAAERAARGNTTTRRLSESQRRALDTAAGRVESSGRRPDRQLRGAAQRVAAGVNDTVYSYVWTYIYDPEAVTFPDQLLDAEIVSAAISVAPYSPEGSAWTTWTVMMLYRLPAR